MTDNTNVDTQNNSNQTVTYKYKSKALALVLLLFLGGLGIHRFYLGSIGLGLLYIFVTLVSIAFPPVAIVTFIMAFVDAFYIVTRDEDYFKRVSSVSVTQ